MLKRFVEQTEPILVTLSTDQMRKYTKQQGHMDFNQTIAQEYITLMGPMISATKLMSSETFPTIGVVLSILAKLRKQALRSHR